MPYEWKFNVFVQAPASKFHNLRDLSKLPLISFESLNEIISMHLTPSVCPLRVLRHSKVFKSKILIDKSIERKRLGVF
jgi:hypothetical protein